MCINDTIKCIKRGWLFFFPPMVEKGYLTALLVLALWRLPIQVVVLCYREVVLVLLKVFDALVWT